MYLNILYFKLLQIFYNFNYFICIYFYVQFNGTAIVIENASGGTPEYIANGHQWIQEQYEGQIQGGNDIRECVSCSANTQMWGRDSRGLPICMNCLNSEGFNRMSMPRQPNRAPKAKAPAVSIYLNQYYKFLYQNIYFFH